MWKTHGFIGTMIYKWLVFHIYASFQEGISKYFFLKEAYESNFRQIWTDGKAELRAVSEEKESEEREVNG